MSGDVWTVPAVVQSVYDGDTLHLRLDLGWRIYFDARIRVIGVNAPELNTDAGKAARLWVVDQLQAFGGDQNGAGVVVRFISHEFDKWGRPLGEVQVTTSQGAVWDLGTELLASGNAVPMAG